MKKFALFLSLFLFGILIAGTAQAVCPVCTVAVVAGVGLSRWLGVDDSISGLWIGGLIISMSAWTLIWLNKKKINFIFRGTIIYLGFFVLTILPLYYTNIMGHPLNKLWGIDKILLGTIVGMAVFAIGTWIHKLFKDKNNGKSYFPYQKIVFPISSLIIVSLIFYLIIIWQK